MSTIISNLLSTELTSVPKWIRAIFGDYYNNALCNGATWMLLFWNLFHIIYNKVFHAFLKEKIGMEQYRRTRVTSSLWLLGFYSSVLAYNVIAMDKEKLTKLKSMRAHYLPQNEDVPEQSVIFYTFMSTFYFHTALSEGIRNNSIHQFLKYVLFCGVCVSSYILRVLEIPFILSALVGFSTICEELTKLFYTALGQKYSLNYVYLRGLYLSTVVVFSLIHLAIVPLLLLIPMGKILISGPNSPIVFVLFSFLVFWLSTALYNSVLSNAMFHWIYHSKEELSEEEKPQLEDKKKVKIHCPGDLIECSLFLQRTDDSYVLNLLKAEINERKMEMVARRKPKSRNMLIQTLKCMMAIKRKINEKRATDSSDSDDSVEEGIRDEMVEDKDPFLDDDLEIEDLESKAKVKDANEEITLDEQRSDVTEEFKEDNAEYKDSFLNEGLERDDQKSGCKKEMIDVNQDTGVDKQCFPLAGKCRQENAENKDAFPDGSMKTVDTEKALDEQCSSIYAELRKGNKTDETKIMTPEDEHGKETRTLAAIKKEVSENNLTSFESVEKCIPDISNSQKDGKNGGILDTTDSKTCASENSSEENILSK